MAALMLTVAFPVNAFAADLDTVYYIDGITLNDPEQDVFGGYRVTRASDPDGVYVASYGWKGDDENTKYYFVRHYVYLQKYDAYVVDWDFGDYGDVDILESDFESSEYTFVGKTTQELSHVNYYEDLNDDSYFTEVRVTRQSDPSGIYGYTTYTKTFNNVVTERGVNIHRFVYAPGTNKLIVDTTFDEVELSDEAFAESEYEAAYDSVFQKEELNWVGDVATGMFGNFVDTAGTHYAVDDDHNVYKLDGDTVTVGNTEYYYLTKTTQVNYDDLTPIVQNDPYFCEHHFINTWYSKEPTCTDFGILNGTCEYCGTEDSIFVDPLGHNYKATVVAPTCTAKGYTLHTCTRCGASYKDNYKNALGHVTVIDKAVPATFKAAGKTQGTHCKRCHKVLTAQKTVAKLGAPKLSKVTPAKKKFTANWAAVKSVDGYQLQYSLKSNFGGSTTVKIAGASAKSKAVAKLKSNKTYYVRIRAYKKINGKMQYSAWSKTLKAKVK